MSPAKPDAERRWPRPWLAIERRAGRVRVICFVCGQFSTDTELQRAEARGHIRVWIERPQSRKALARAVRKHWRCAPIAL